MPQPPLPDPGNTRKTILAYLQFRAANETNPEVAAMYDCLAMQILAWDSPYDIPPGSPSLASPPPPP